MIAWVLLILSLSVIVYVVYTHRKKRISEIETADDSIPANDEFTVIDYNGFKLPMKYDELELWNSMDRNERRDQVRKMKEMLANGTIIEIVPDPSKPDDIRYVPADEEKVNKIKNRIEAKESKIETVSPLRKVK